MQPTKTIERWKPVVGFETMYEVSDQGRVRSYRRGGIRILKPGPKASGHVSVALGRGNSYDVHYLVLRAFVGPRPKGFECRHLNGNPRNNKLSNLEYNTRSQNIRDKKWHNGVTPYGLRIQDIVAIKRRLKSSHRGIGAALARKYKTTECTISAIKHGRLHKEL